MGRWHNDARRFLSHHRDELTVLPLAVFAMGPRTVKDEGVADSRKQRDHALAKEPRLDPVTVAIFGGVVNPAKQQFPFTHMDASDARDWDEIRSWPTPSPRSRCRPLSDQRAQDRLRCWRLAMEERYIG